MHLKHYVAALAAALSFGSANAALLLGSNNAAGNIVTDYSTPGAVSFDLDLATLGDASLRFQIEAQDLAGPLSLNALVRNLSGMALSRFDLSLQGISFLTAGSVTPTFGKLGSVASGAGYANIAFASPEWAEFHFGNPLALDGKNDWILDTRGLAVGDTFVISADIPEPSTFALFLPALCMAGVMAARRRQRG
ncbi:PEP-CTERM sorting domain-containing protein [Massilia sp. Leaf139]|uniref:PEP-CTERM sorting domain-containing protein n=1 Tax=Massilia sp. Leaf139 TaxID=1736272 RepID=UPI0006F68D5E|nr:PEP-CTERM sorting domain-containing protein [Massilia sp. Leaf139]KQQ86892.1 PEP-CTERM domain protein [Massilia sp. Leaf139]